MNLTTVILEDDKKPVFLGEMGLENRIGKKQPARGSFSCGNVNPKKKKKAKAAIEQGFGRKAVFAQNSKCHYCQCQMELSDGTKQKPNTATVDHKVPVSRGGRKLGAANKVLACASCNTDKGKLTEGEYFAVLEYRKRNPDN